MQQQKMGPPVCMLNYEVSFLKSFSPFLPLTKLVYISAVLAYHFWYMTLVSASVYIKKYISHVRTSPQVLSMWLQIVKFIVKKSKCTGLAQEIDFLAPNLCRLHLQWLVRGTTQFWTSKKRSVINWTWLWLSISDWSINIIGSGGLLLVVPTYVQF
jgi:hypothetical protein